MLSENNRTEKEDLFVQLNGNHYEYNRKDTGLGVSVSKVMFKDNQARHSTFWLKYKRPPKTSYQDYIIESRHLLVPQDIREIKGAYYTPQVWVQKSQEYLAEVLGENWQDEYYIWDCCAGTGNMENGLVNKYNIWASTIDQADVDVMKERIKNGANLLESHIFQFDFLNDEFSEKCPKDLLNILCDPEKRKKLIIYINPPYKETTSTNTISSKESKHKKNVAGSKIKIKYQNILKQGSKELYVQFLTRCYFEIEGAYIANFSTLKTLQGTHFKEFRDIFLAKLKKLFIVPACTFDNIKGEFPIGFFIWDTKEKVKFDKIDADVFNEKDQFIGIKEITNPPNKNIKDWLREFKDAGTPLGYLVRGSSDVQNNRVVFITWKPSDSVINAGNASSITKKNIIENAIFYSVRTVIKKTWINDRDQYLYPNNNWENDKKFQSDCLVYTIFNNRIKSNDGINYWIPYLEREVDAKNNFASNFMTDYIKRNNIDFSNAAKSVLNVGKELLIYYHSKENSDPNASILDIKEYFQDKDKSGNLKQTSTDEKYLILRENLTIALKVLANNIIPKVYEYGFL